MWINVRTMDGKRSERIDGLSKLTPVSELRGLIEESFDVPSDRQRLFYRGKQMEDGHSLFDYSVGLNEIIQLFIKPATVAPVTVETAPPVSDVSEGLCVTVFSSYKVGDAVDVRDSLTNGWFEGTIVAVKPTNENTDKNDVIYDVKMDESERVEEGVVVERVRPRATNVIPWDSLTEGQAVMVNYNPENPDSLGFWFDAVISEVSDCEGRRLVVNITPGPGLLPVGGCVIAFPDDVMAIESHPDPQPITQSSQGEESEVTTATDSANDIVGDPESDELPDGVKCNKCSDVDSKLCKECGCGECGGKSYPDKQLLCDECDSGWHIYCLTPPLDSVPDVDEWYCPLCKNDSSEVVTAGQGLKESKKKSKMASATSLTSRDWGRGMACVGRTKECTLVPPNHFGPVPGVPVGTCWKFRVQASESGVHRPHVAGIHGREIEGSYSIVLSGGYEDDVDDGDEFTYTGSGGRDLSGNKRTAEQSCDQKLTKTNRALSRNCNAVFDNKKGAEASDWQGGRAVRVIRNYKAAKHSRYAPEEGNRYDGIYKVVKYWPAKGKSGFIVWRYLLRRDDVEPAPWTEAGEKRAAQLGLAIIYPDGYLDGDKENKQDAKRKRSQKNDDKSCDDEPSVKPAAKRKAPVVKSSVPADILEMIATDVDNSKLWRHVRETGDEFATFLKTVEESFTCICCQEVVYQPITTQCAHNICKVCLTRSFSAEIYTCPVCRHDLGQTYQLTPNKHLQQILVTLFPGYTAGR